MRRGPKVRRGLGACPWSGVAALGLGCILFGLFVCADVEATPTWLGRTPLDVYTDNLIRGAAEVPGELVLTLGPDATEGAPRLAKSVGCVSVSRFGRRPIFLWRCADGSPASDRIAALQDLKGVAWVEANYLEVEEQEERVPDDLSEQAWHHRNVGQLIDGEAGVPGADLGSTAAWTVSTGAPEVIVAINDVGIFAEHEDLRGNIWRNADEDCDNGRDDDGNGYVDDCVGYDVADEDNDPDPRTLPELQANGDVCQRTHGTFLAGLVAAAGDNGRGVSGVVWSASLMNVKKRPDLDCRPTVAQSIAASIYAVDNGADIMVMAFSSPAYSATFEQVLQEAEAGGMLLVMSAGNSAEDVDAVERYPVYYDLDHHLVVANTTHQDTLRSLSNFGAQRVDLGAPGTAVLSTTLDGYEARTGTSYAVPMVAGAGALLWAAWPELPLADVSEAIVQGVQPLESLDCASGSACVRTGGRLDLVGAQEVAAALAGPASIQIEAVVLVGYGQSYDGSLLAGREYGLEVYVRNVGGEPTGAITARVSAQGLHPELSIGDEAADSLAAGFRSWPSPLVTAPISVSSACVQGAPLTLEVEVADDAGHRQVATVESRVRCGPALDAEGLPPEVRRTGACACAQAPGPSRHSTAWALVAVGLLALGVWRRS